MSHPRGLPHVASDFLKGSSTIDFLGSRFLSLFQDNNVACPVCGEYVSSISEAVVMLNDHHHWPREQIADWLESIGW